MITYASRMGDGQTIAYKLLGILHHIAPDADAQNICARMFNGVPEGVERDKAMTLALADGYMFGNWPWTLPPRT